MMRVPSCVLLSPCNFRTTGAVQFSPTQAVDVRTALIFRHLRTLDSFLELWGNQSDDYSSESNLSFVYRMISYSLVSQAPDTMPRKESFTYVVVMQKQARNARRSSLVRAASCECPSKVLLANLCRFARRTWVGRLDDGLLKSNIKDIAICCNSDNDRSIVPFSLRQWFWYLRASEPRWEWQWAEHLPTQKAQKRKKKVDRFVGIYHHFFSNNLPKEFIKSPFLLLRWTTSY